jgi:hypothetical protein
MPERSELIGDEAESGSEVGLSGGAVESTCSNAAAAGSAIVQHHSELDLGPSRTKGVCQKPLDDELYVF